MKKYFYTPVLVVLLTAFSTVRAQDRQDYLGLPGDNLNLFAVMKLFQESETLESFERSLNDENTVVNNLDLNGDGYVDYIRVIDNIDRNVHFIVLQVAISPRENQDVAVFTVVQESNGQVSIQLVGDEALYGRNYIVEPIFDETPNPGYSGRKTYVRTNTYEIAAWPVIRFIYRPAYTIWISPWHWDYYPSYWRPWNSYYWHYYYGYHHNYYSYYYGHYRHWNNHRYDYWHNNYYTHHRHYSPYVHSRINDGYYKKTYSRPEQRSEGAALYRRTRQASSSRPNVSSSGGRRTSNDNGTVRSSGGTRTSTDGTRTSTSSGTRNSSGSGTRTSTSSGTRNSSGSGTRTSTSSGTRESTSPDTRTSTGSGTRTSTNPDTRKSTSTTTRESSGSGSDARRSSTSGGNRESTSPSTEKKESSATNSGRRSGSSSSGSSSSGSSSKSTKESKSTSTERSSGRR